MKHLSKRQFFILSYFAYASIYIARLNLTIASPVMQKQGLLTFSQIGMMGGAFFLCYSIGQLLNGFLGDMLPPRHMIATGLLFTAIGNLCIGLLPSAGIILVLWGINGFSQSMLWGPLLRLLAENFPGLDQAKTASLLNSSVGIGSILGIFIATAAIYYQDVRFAFFLPGFIALFAAVSIFFFFPVPDPHRYGKKETISGFSSRLKFLCSPGLLVLLLPAMFHGVLKDNLNLWAASYFADTYSLALTELSFYVIIIPLLTLFGRLIYPFIFHLCRSREHTVSTTALAIIVLCMIPLCLRGTPIAAAAICLSITAAAISVTNNSFLSVYPTRYSKSGCVSSVVGLMDFSTYLGAGVSSILYGRLLEKNGYPMLFVSWLILSMLSILFIHIHNHIKKRRNIMNEKVILISIDGMRPDGALNCGNPFVQKLTETSSYTLEGHSVIPTVTLPCHTSMFYGVPPKRHGILTNIYTPPVRPIPGIAEVLCAAHKTCAAFYNWEPIRHIWTSECMKHTSYIHAYEENNSDLLLAEQAIALIHKKQPDFLFIHMVETDEKGGHDHGWMSPEYLNQLSNAFSCTEKIFRAAAGQYSIIITADHGGHDRMHGEDCPEDFTIPMFFYGKYFHPGEKLRKAGLLDLAPTIAALMNIPIPREWEGQILCSIE